MVILHTCCKGELNPIIRRVINHDRKFSKNRKLAFLGGFCGKFDLGVRYRASRPSPIDSASKNTSETPYPNIRNEAEYLENRYFNCVDFFKNRAFLQAYEYDFLYDCKIARFFKKINKTKIAILMFG